MLPYWRMLHFHVMIALSAVVIISTVSTGLSRELTVEKGKSSANAFNSVQKALNAAQPGDVVTIVGGLHRERVVSVRSGLPHAPITIRGVNGAKLVSPQRHKGRLLSIYHDYLVLRDMSISGGDIPLYIFGGSHNRILENTIFDAGGECIRIKYNAKKNLVLRNKIYDCGNKGFDLNRSKKNGEGVYMGTAPEQLKKNAKERVPRNAPLGRPDNLPDTTSFNIISDNVISVPAECVDIKEGSSHNIIRNNVCSGNRDKESGGFSSRGDRNTFTGNRLEGQIAGAGVRLGGDDDDQGINNIVIGNDLRNTGGYAIKDVREPQMRVCGNRIGQNAEGLSKSGIDPSAQCS